MIRKIFLFLILLIGIQGGSPLSFIKDILNNSQQTIDDWYYTYSLAMIFNNNEDRSAEYANIVQKNCIKYSLDSRIVSRLIFKESWFIKYKKSYGYEDFVTTNFIKIIFTNFYITNNKYLIKVKTNNLKLIHTNELKYVIACGPMMVRPKYWSHLLYSLELGLNDILLNSKDIDRDHIKYLCTIKYGIPVGCKILNYYLNKNNYNYNYALTKYWAGKNSKHFRQMKNNGKMNHYVNDIIYGNLEKQILKYYSKKWKYYNVSDYEKKMVYHKYGKGN